MSQSDSRTGPSRRLWPAGVLIVAVAIGGAVFIRSGSDTAPSDPALTTSVPLDSIRPAVVSDRGYVGSEACRSCHAQEHATWHASYHRTMTQPALPKNIGVSLDGVSVELSGASFSFTQNGDEIQVEMPNFGTDEPGDRIQRRIVLVTGSHHMHIFWHEVNESRILSMLPIAYRLDEQRWIPRTSAFLNPPPDDAMQSEFGRWNMECILCHNTDPRTRCDNIEPNCDSQVAEFGISCEACHGPGLEHVEMRTAAADAQASPEELAKRDPIVNPESLHPRLASQVCAQCHSLWVLSREDHFVSINEGFRYRPGEELTKSSMRRLIKCCGAQGDPAVDELKGRVEDYDSTVFWSDGMIRVTGREYQGLVESPCYEGGKFSCLSCHTLHAHNRDSDRLGDWANDQLKPNVEENDACLQCHTEYQEDLAAHTHHALDSAGSRCVNCHMPNTTYGLLKATRSHEISSPSVESFLNTERPQACNLCHLDQTLGWSAEHLADWYGQPVPDLPGTLRTTSAAVHQILSGDAGQRALVAWSFGWQPAQEASGTAWMAPFLLTLMDDPYDAVRQIAFGSLRTLPAYKTYEFEFTRPGMERAPQLEATIEEWRRSAPEIRSAVLLFGDDAQLDMERLRALLAIRNDRPMTLSE